MTSSNYDEHFSIANVPFGIASRRTKSALPQAVTRLGPKVYFLPEALDTEALPLRSSLSKDIQHALRETTLNTLASLGRLAHLALRHALQDLLKVSNHGIQQALLKCSSDVDEVEMHLPVAVGDFSDFSCSLHHVLNASQAVMGKRSTPPGFAHFPAAYGGRASSIVVSGTPIRRPVGMSRSPDGVAFGASTAMDFELEVACIIGQASKMGEPIPISKAKDHIFGFVLLNDWSARDIQALEMNPLGPFLGKSAGTTISPWVVTADALQPFSKKVFEEDNSQRAPYLRPSDGQVHYDVNLQADLIGETEAEARVLCKSKLDWLHWGIEDMIAHQTINGCSLRAGDILATGTISGSERGALGCMLEIIGGTTSYANGSKERYLEDNDGIRMTAWAGELKSEYCVGFGQCYGRLEPAIPWKDGL